MIIDTSALIAVLTGEEGSEALVGAIVGARGGMPAPALVEVVRVARQQRLGGRVEADDLRAKLERRGCATLAVPHDHARLAHGARTPYGYGNGTAGPRNHP